MGSEQQDEIAFGGWLASCFADPAWIERAHRRFQSDPARMVVIDDALETSRYRLLSRALREDCEWATRRGLVRRRTPARPAGTWPTEWVDATGFAEAEPEERFFQHQAFVQARPGRALSPGMIGLIQFKSLLTKADFLEMLGRITGTRPQGLQEMLIRRMVRGDLAKPHDDAIGGRTFCLLLYLSDGWQPAYDGRLIMHMPGGEHAVDPLPNRMVLFAVNTRINHSVRPLSEIAADWSRYNLSIWFS